MNQRQSFQLGKRAGYNAPFEFTAHEINTGRNPEGQWDAYDSGVEAGIKAGIKKRLVRVAA